MENRQIFSGSFDSTINVYELQRIEDRIIERMLFESQLLYSMKAEVYKETIKHKKRRK